MTLREQVYKFGDLDIHASITMQSTIELRKMDLNQHKEALNEKTLKTLTEELDQMYDDLDRHMAKIIRDQEREKELKTREVSESATR